MSLLLVLIWLGLLDAFPSFDVRVAGAVLWILAVLGLSADAVMWIKACGA